MAPSKECPKPQEPNNPREELQGIPILPPTSAPKRPRIAQNLPLTTTDSSFVTTPESTEEDSNAGLSPGHAPGYIPWERAPAVDLSNETEEQKKRRLNKRHAPTGKRGTRCINDGTIDRTHALLGQPDLSKLVINFQTEQNDQYTNEVLEGNIKYVYEDGGMNIRVDWNDARFIQALNNWRSQIIRRAIGKAYDTQEFWTVQEQEIITDIVRTYLNEGKDIDWLQIARDYNGTVKYIYQDKGTPGAPRRYHCPGSDNKTPREAISTSMPLQEHRQAPPRADWVLRQEMGFFLAPEAIAVMDRLRSSGLLQRNGSPPFKPGKKAKRVIKQVKGKAATQRSSEEQESHLVSTTHDKTGSMVQSPSEFISNPEACPLTQPRPLMPRPHMPRPPPVAEPESIAPPPRRYKKRTAYNTEILYDKPSTEPSTFSPGFNSFPPLGKQALNILAEQEAVMYDHLPQSRKRVPTYPAARAPNNMRSASAEFGPSRSLSFEQTSTSSEVHLDDSAPVQVAAVDASLNLAQRREHRLGLGNSPIQTHAPYVPRPGATMVPIWEMQRRRRGAAVAKSGGEASDINSKQPSPAEPTLEL